MNFEVVASAEWLAKKTCPMDDGAVPRSWLLPTGCVVFYRTDGLGREAWRMELELFHPTGCGPSILLGGRRYYEFSFGHPERPHMAISAFKQPLVATGSYSFPENEWTRLTIERCDGHLAVTLGDSQFCVTDPDPDRLVKDLTLELAAGTRFRDFAIAVGGRKGSAWRQRPLRSLLRSVTIDFNDDLVRGPWNQDMVARQMQLYKESGIRRVYFIPTAHPKDGYWNMPNPAHRRHIVETADAIGDFLPAFVQAAKACDLEFFAVFKPFDFGFEKDAVPFNSPEAREKGGFDSLSGVISRSTDWLKAHPSLRLKRHPEDLERVGKVREIRHLVLRCENGLLDADFALWASDDNLNYRKIEGRSTHRAEGAQVFELASGTPQRLVILREPGSDRRFGNRLNEWVRCFDAEGEEVPISFGTASYGEFPNAFFRFDTNLAGRQQVVDGDSYWWMEEKVPLAIVSGYEPYIVGAASPAWPQVRAHWLDELARCLDCGCDGVDIRVANHNRSLEWERYGFDDPVLGELGSRPSAKEVRACLGRHYSQFIAAASRLATARGRRLHLHLEHGFQPSHLPCDMNIAFEWERWLEQGWADEVTLMTHSAASGIMPLMMDKARKLGIPVNIRPYFASMIRGIRAQSTLQGILNEVRAYGLDGLNLYENAVFFEVDSNRDVRLKATAAPWWKMLTT